MWDEIEKKAGRALIRFVLFLFLFVFYFALSEILKVLVPDGIHKPLKVLNQKVQIYVLVLNLDFFTYP